LIRGSVGIRFSFNTYFGSILIRPFTS